MSQILLSSYKLLRLLSFVLLCLHAILVLSTSSLKLKQIDDIAPLHFSPPPRTTERSMALDALLAKVAVTSLDGLHSLLALDSTCSIFQAAEFLAEHNILSCPVIKAGSKEDAPCNERFLGIVDMANITFFLVNGEQELDALCKLGSDTLRSPGSITQVTMPMVPIRSDASILDALRIHGYYQVHRFAVSDPATNRLTNYVSQYTTLKWIDEHAAELAPVGKKTLEQLGFHVPALVIFVTPDQLAEEVFSLMGSRNLSGVPVVDPRTHATIGDVTDSDLCMILSHKDASTIPAMRVAELLQLLKDVSPAPLRTITFCKASDTLESVIAALLRNRAHRAYVWDEGLKCTTRVLSLGDILAKYASPPPPDFGANLAPDM